MKMKFIAVKLFCFVSIFYSNLNLDLLLKVRKSCDLNFKQCDNGECKKSLDFCNNERDCIDFSDEMCKSN